MQGLVLRLPLTTAGVRASASRGRERAREDAPRFVPPHGGASAVSAPAAVSAAAVNIRAQASVWTSVSVTRG